MKAIDLKNALRDVPDECPVCINDVNGRMIEAIIAWGIALPTDPKQPKLFVLVTDASIKEPEDSIHCEPTEEKPDDYN